MLDQSFPPLWHLSVCMCVCVCVNAYAIKVDGLIIVLIFHAIADAALTIIFLSQSNSNGTRLPNRRSSFDRTESSIIRLNDFDFILLYSPYWTASPAPNRISNELFHMIKWFRSIPSLSTVFKFFLRFSHSKQWIAVKALPKLIIAYDTVSSRKNLSTQHTHTPSMLPRLIYLQKMYRKN